MKTIALLIASAIALALPAFAQATPAYVTSDAPLMAGPDQDYPQVDLLREGSQVDIQGCTPGWQWCDVIAYDERGWMPGEALEIDAGQQWMPAMEYGPAYGLPIVAFSIQGYWDNYYRYRPFYAQRWSWYRWRPPYRRWHGWNGGHGWNGSHMPPRVMPMPHPIYGNHNPPPRVMPLPHPIYGNHNPPPRVMPMPHPIYGNHNPPPRVMPMPHPRPNPPRVVPMPHPIYGNPPPRVVPMPHPVPAHPPIERPHRQDRNQQQP